MTQMETWAVFSGGDLLLGAIGLVGLISVLVVITAASSNVTKREISIKNRKND